jgi:regulator of nucleoside diphosphate kinase
MSDHTCTLTTKDLTILEVLHDRCLGRDDLLAPILKRKIEAASVVFRDDVPADVATLSSRVTFSVDGRDPDTRVLSHDRMTSPVGLFLPITTVRGLALIGLAEGQEFAVTNAEGAEERIMLQRVEYQPEAARRGRDLLAGPVPARHVRPPLRLVRGGLHYQSPVLTAEGPGTDDPGPSAA